MRGMGSGCEGLVGWVVEVGRDGGWGVGEMGGGELGCWMVVEKENAVWGVVLDPVFNLHVREARL